MTVQTFQANVILFSSQVKVSKFTHLSTSQIPKISSLAGKSIVIINKLHEEFCRRL
jgi:hypothetical protein